MEILSKKTISTIKANRIKESGTKSKYYTKDSSFIRPPYAPKNRATVIRTEGIVDTECILNIPFYNRYADKTQVYSLYKNDDITRRALHVQLVSRIARDIGGALGLNTDLIEAIALGHDLGHTPFGHLGESILNRIFYEHTNRHFMHNVQSVRILYNLCPVGISLQTLDGVLCHNGEFEVQGMHPFDKNTKTIKSFKDLDTAIEKSYTDGNDYARTLVPSTLEGAIVRFSDIIAYIGKDRIDATKLGRKAYNYTENGTLSNSTIIRSLTEDMVENSIDKDCIMLSERGFELIKSLKKENYDIIYKNADANNQFGDSNGGVLLDIFNKLYEQMLKDLKANNERSPIFTHHINYLKSIQKKDTRDEYIKNYMKDRDDNTLNQIVVDFIASMTDSYFMEITKLLFSDFNLEYMGYFNDKIKNDEYLKSIGR